MIKVDELYITKGGKLLIADLSIKDLPYFENIFIDSIIIETQDTYSDFGVSNHSFKIYTLEDLLSLQQLPEVEIFSQLDEGSEGMSDNSDNGNEEPQKELSGVKHVRFELDIDGFDQTLFFLNIHTVGEFANNTPCSFNKNHTIILPVYNKHFLFQKSLKMIQSVKDGCDYDKNFIDFILKLKAFELSLLTGNYNWAIEYWNKFNSLTNSNLVNKDCNCHA